MIIHRMKVYIITGILALFISIPVLSQQYVKRPAVITEINRTTPGEGLTQVIQDRKIDDMLSKYIDTNAKKTTIPGFKLFLFTESTQMIAYKHALEAQGKFLKYFPDVDTELQYVAPDWKLYVGNFRNRTDALRLKMQLSSLFPNAIIVSRQIEYQKL